MNTMNLRQNLFLRHFKVREKNGRDMPDKSAILELQNV